MCRQLFSFALLLGVLNTACFNQPTALAAQQSVTLRRVAEFGYGPNSWGEPPFARFDPSGRLVYLFKGLDLQVINWKTSRVVASASYERLPCDWKRSAIDQLLFVPGEPAIVARHCDSLYMLDSETLAIGDRFFSGAMNGVTMSLDGRLLAVSTLTEGDRTPYQIHVFALNRGTYHAVSTWNASGHGAVDGLSFNQDGTMLAIGRMAGNTPDDKFTERTGVEVRRVSSGELITEWWRERSDGYIHNPRFVPGRPDLIATERNRCTSFLFEFWEARTGRKLSDVVHSHVDDQCWGTHEIIAPDWSWAVTSHYDDPDDTSYIQAFVVCDPWSGRVLYETPRKYWTFFDHLAFHTGILFFLSPKSHELADVSKDGRYLLTLEYDRFVVYEVVEAE